MRPRFIYNSTFLTLLITTAGFLPLLIVTGFIIPGGDAMTQVYPFVVETKRMFSSGDWPLWSWNTFYGDNFIAQYSYYTVTNPFAWLAAIFPYEHIDIGLALSLYLRLLVCAWLAEYFFRRHGFGKSLSMLGALLLTFSSWTIANLYYGFFIEPVIAFLVLMIFVDRLLRGERHKWSGLILGAFVVAWMNYYLMPGSILAAAVYYLCHLVPQPGSVGSKVLKCLKSIGCILLGVGIASVVTLPTLYQLGGSERGGFTPGLVYTNIAWRAITLFLPAVHEGIRPFYIILHCSFFSNQANIAVFGILPAALYAYRHRRDPATWFLVICVIAYVTPLNGIFTLYSRSVYSRWAYALTFAVVLATLCYLRENPAFTRRPLRAYIWICIGIVAVCTVSTVAWMLFSGKDAHSIDAPGRIFYMTMQALLLTVNLTCLALVWRKSLSDTRRDKTTIWCIAVCASLQILATTLSHTWSVYDDKGFGNECLRSTYINQNPRPFEHRSDIIARDFTSSANSSLVFNRPSTHSFNSTRNAAINQFTEYCTETTGYEKLFVTYTDRAATDALLSVKTLIDYDSIVAKGANPRLTGRRTNGDSHFEVYGFDHYIPMGFAYDSYLLSEEIDSIVAAGGKSAVPMMMLGSIVIDRADEAELAPYMLHGATDSVPDMADAVEARRRVHGESFRGDTRGFSASIDLDSAAVVFYSVPADPGFTATIDGLPTKIYRTNLGFSAIVVGEGHHDIRFDFFPRGLKAGAAVSLACLILSLLVFLHRPSKRNE